MKIDIIRQIGLVTRSVATREHAGKPAKVVVASRTYDTDIHDLWDAVTNPERIPRWFLPVTGELHLGGRYSLKGNASGQILRCEPPHHLALTWEFNGDTSWVDLRLGREQSGGTRLELEHTAHVDGDFYAKFGPGAVGVGWDLSLIGLGLYLASNTAVDPAAFEAWTLSDEGKRYVGLGSDDWARAAIAGGDDETAARAAAARTAAFYRGEAAPT